MGLIRGKVVDTGGAALVRTVRAYRRDTGALVGETTSGSGAPGGDPHYSLVRSLYPMDEYDPMAPYVRDRGPAGGYFNLASGSASLDTAIKKFGAASVALGTLNCVARVTGDTTQTVEAHIRFNESVGGAGGVVFGSYSDTYGVVVTLSAGKLSLAQKSLSYPQVRATGPTSMVAGTWYHVALVVGSTWVKLYLDGVIECLALRTEFYAADVIAARMYFNADQVLTHADNIRITAAERYTSNFTPPTAAYPTFQEDAGTGAFALDTGAYTGPCAVVAYGNDGENASIYDHIIPA